MSDWLDKIELYVGGKLSSDERSAFELELSNSEDLRLALERYRVISQALEFEVQDNLRTHLQGLKNNQTKEKAHIQKFTGFKFIAVAASLALLITAGYWILVNPSKTNQLALNDMYQTVEVSTTRGDQIPQELSQGFELATQNKTDEAIVFFEAQLDMDATNYTARFMLGDLYKKRGELRKAKNEMRIILDGQSLIWFEKAQLNYLLLSMEIGWDVQSNNVMTNILNDVNHPYLEQAKQIKLRQSQHE